MIKVARTEEGREIKINQTTYKWANDSNCFPDAALVEVACNQIKKENMETLQSINDIINIDFQEVGEEYIELMEKEAGIINI